MFFKIKNMKGQKIPGVGGGVYPAYGLWSDHRTIPTMVRPSDHPDHGLRHPRPQGMSVRPSCARRIDRATSLCQESPQKWHPQAESSQV